ncbi:odorant receptor 131-2-like [Clupea harengus]|uniref:Odorant receptor 131-2-like n=1 Tax=Clupea harengus TaxID=7950 RepID=A0A6P8FHG4_CLUHA|nr:odorant receptor 131-2-like [Clupea harengus]
MSPPFPIGEGCSPESVRTYVQSPRNMSGSELQERHMVMNLTNRDGFQEALVKYLIIVILGIVINCINGIIVLTFCKNSVFHGDSRYILYMNLVVNDMIMICVSVTLYVLTYAYPIFNASMCCILIVTASTTHRNTPIILAGMAIERYIAICKPLHHAQVCTVHRTYIIIALTWGVGFVPAVADVIIVLATRPIGFFSKGIFCFPPNLYNTRYHKEKMIVDQVLYLSFVWLTLMYTYFMIFRTARAAKGDTASAKKAQNTILLHGAQLLLCMLSYVTPYLDIVLITFFPIYRSKITFLTYLISNIIPRLLSPLIYSVRDQKFAKNMSQYYSCKVISFKGGLKRRRLKCSSKRVCSLKG